MLGYCICHFWGQEMGTKSVQALLDDICLLNPASHELVEAIRALVKKRFKPFSEAVKYGGIIFASGVQFCGVFAYKEHVTVEFGYGAKIDDSFGLLEGKGKGRRHLKFRTLADIKEKRLEQYLPLALDAAKSAA
jgi:hypothetical protein